MIAQTLSPAKSALLARYAHAVVAHVRGEDFSDQVRALTGGDGVDVITDNVGTPLFEAMRRSLAVNGRWVLVGQLSGDFVPFNPAQLFLRNQSMLSVHSTSRAQLEDVLALIDRRAIEPVIAATMPLCQAAAAHAQVEASAVAGRLVQTP